MSKNIEKQYLKLLKDILDNGVEKQDRTGTGTISVFGRQIRHDMSKGFPLLTTKKMYWKGIVTELIWFLRGDTNIKYLVDRGCNIWNGDAYKNYISKQTKPKIGDYENYIDCYCGHTTTCDCGPLTQEEFINKIKTDDEFAKKWGELGPIYGKQWRRRGKWTDIATGWHHGAATDFKRVYEVDQISNLIEDARVDPDSRRLIVDAWNPDEASDMVLPPCHMGFQIYTRELSNLERYNYWFTRNYETGMERNFDPHNLPDFDNDYYEPTPERAVSLMWWQRSVDVPLGLPFNIASYALLLHIIAKSIKAVPDQLIGNLGDTHIYKNQIDGVKEQITREPMNLPRLEIKSGNENWHILDIDDIINSMDHEYTFNISGYKHHPAIKFPLSN